MNRTLPGPAGDVALLLARLILGTIMFAHAYQKLFVDGVGEEAEEPVDAPHAAEELVTRRRQLVLPQVDVARLAHRVEPLVGDEARDEDAWLRHPAAPAPTSSPVRWSLLSESATRSRAALRFSRELA